MYGTAQEQPLPEPERKTGEKMTNTTNEEESYYGAKTLLLLTGFLVALGGSMLLSSGSQGSIASFDDGDDTRILFIDSLWCHNGNCVGSDSPLWQSQFCDSFGGEIAMLSWCTTFTGAAMLSLVCLAFSQLLLRTMVSLIAAGAGGWRDALYACDAKCKSWRNSLRSRRGISAFIGGVLMCGLAVLNSLIIGYTLRLVSANHVPCPDTQSWFNQSLPSKKGFMWGRAVYLNLMGSFTVLFSAAIWLVWLLSVICYRFATLESDSDDEQSEEPRDASGDSDRGAKSRSSPPLLQQRNSSKTRPRSDSTGNELEVSSPSEGHRS